jgi:hypothetical protein
MSFTKTTCPVSRKQFTAKATNVIVRIAGQDFTLSPRQFATDSLGWNLSQKVQITVDGVPVTCQVGLNITLVGSKELPTESQAEASKGLEKGSEASVAAATGTPEVQAILRAQKAKRDAEEAAYKASQNGKQLVAAK